MKKITILVSSIFVLLLGFSLPTFAIELKSGDNIIVSAPVLDDMYLLAGNATIDSDVIGDLHVLAGSVTINGNVSEDLVVAGGRVAVFGNVDGDLRVVGGQVSVFGQIGDDAVILGGVTDLTPDSVVNGTVLAAAGSLDIEGTVKEDVQGGLGMFILRGTVEGDVNVTIEDTITLADDAKILGDLNYSALLEAEFPPGVIDGAVNFNEFERDSNQLSQEDLTMAYLIYKFISLLSALILVFIFVMLMPKALESSAKLTKDNVLKCFGIGVLTMIVIFIGTIILMMTIVGIPLALLALAFFLFVLYVSKVFVAAWLAGYVVNFKKKRLYKTRLLFTMFGAMLVYYLVGLIPFVGWVVNILLFLIGVGAIMLIKSEYYQFLRSKKKV
ncbi:hypothetical protein GF354_05535 [Candidatus Peregrinibacteria bacterium]|nr:hypothetical protein [Candidatus Peregrinibacteria bacterium]